MSNREINPDYPVITGLFAHYCGPWVYEKYVKDLFAQRGYELLVPHLPIGDPSLTEDDFASIIRAKQRERGATEYIDLAHSWSGELTYRQLGSAPVSMLIEISTPLRKVAEKAGIPKDHHSHSVEYHALAKAEELGEVDFEHEREVIGRRFFSKLGDKALQAWATSQLAPHPHKPKSEADPPDDKAVLPDDIPIHYVGLENDSVYFYESQERLVEKIREKQPSLSLEFSSLPTDHFPMLEAPELFVNHIVEIIRKERQKKRSSIWVRQPATVN